jgi:nucleotide-binding universal stress UspA family protein
MTFPFRNILVPMDLDETTAVVLKLAEDLARDHGGKVYLLHVVEPSEHVLLQRKYHPWESGGGDIAAARKTATAALEVTARQRLGATPWEVLTRVGEPAETVLRVQKELAADLVVMGTHGSHGLSQLVLGSVAQRVVRNSPCPVLTVRTG